MSDARTPSFGGNRDAYAAFRPSYPDALFDRILAALPATHRQRAADLGAGTGLSTLPLCRSFAEVLAIEPDQHMSAALHDLHPAIRVLHTSAEQAQIPPASLDLVTSATAFYWMDGDRVARLAQQWLRPRGVLAVYRYGIIGGPDGLMALMRREMHERWDAVRHPRLRDEDYSRRTIAAVPGWASVEIFQVPNNVPLPADRVVGFLRTASYVHAYTRTLADAEAYYATLEAELRRTHPGDLIPVNFGLELVLARNP